MSKLLIVDDEEGSGILKNTPSLRALRRLRR